MSEYWYRKRLSNDHAYLGEFYALCKFSALFLCLFLSPAKGEMFRKYKGNCKSLVFWPNWSNKNDLGQEQAPSRPNAKTTKCGVGKIFTWSMATGKRETSIFLWLLSIWKLSSLYMLLLPWVVLARTWHRCKTSLFLWKIEVVHILSINLDIRIIQPFYL